MSAAGDYVMGKTTALVQHCEHTQSLLRTVLDWAEDSHYDPVSDVHNLRLPGATVRAIRAALEPPKEDNP